MSGLDARTTPRRGRAPVRIDVPSPSFIVKSGEDRIGRRRFGWS